MGTVAGMLAEARRSLGLSGRPNYITKDYANRHGSYFASAPWCDMAVTYWARHSGNTAAVLPGGDRAYTVWHAQDFQKAGRWHTGTTANVNKARPGDVVFFDWGLSNSIGAIDHVGVVEKALGGGRVQTIEGNTGDRCLRRVRSSSVIAGYGRPAYANEEDDMPSAEEIATAVWKHKISNQFRRDSRGNPRMVAAEDFLEYTDSHFDRIMAALKAFGPDVDEDAIVAGILAGLTPERIASAIPPELAEQVVTALGERLGSA